MKFVESEQLELKSSFNEWKEIIISLCALANKEGGQVIVGFDDESGYTDLKVGKSTIEDFVNKIRQNTDPVLYPGIQVKTFVQGEIVEITLPKSDYKPVFAFGKSYTRVGKNNVKLSAVEIRELIKKFTLPDIDALPTKIDYADFDSDKKLEDPNGKNYTELIDNFAIVKNHKITLAGYLCFARENKQYTHAIVKAARFKGDKPVNFIDMQDFSDNLLRLPEQIIGFIKKHINMAVIISGNPQREEKWDYPLPALREAIINALVHRNYEDKGNIQVRIFDHALEIWSPGTLPKEIDINNIEETNRSIPRNKQIADIFYHFGLIEQWGTGLLRIINYCREEQMPDPEFKHHQGALIIRFSTAGNVGKDVTENVTENREVKIIDLIRGNSAITTTELAKHLKVTRRTIAREIESLKNKHKIKRIGGDKGGYWEIIQSG